MITDAELERALRELNVQERNYSATQRIDRHN
jgi:hypothetical protein